MEDNNDELLDEQNEVVEAQVSLPQDIQQTVLSFLSGRVVLKLRAVCRFWRDCIEEPNFIDRHLNNALCFHQSIAFFTSVDHGLFCMYTFDPTTMNCKSLEFILSCKFQMSDPCNGLVCAYDSKGDVEVLNPTTMKHVILPVSELQSQTLSSEYFLGSVHSTNVHKVVCIRHRLRFLTYEVCTIGTQSWRVVRESADFLKTTKAVIVNDVMHWLLLDEVSSHFTRRQYLHCDGHISVTPKRTQFERCWTNFRGACGDALSDHFIIVLKRSYKSITTSGRKRLTPEES